MTAMLRKPLKDIILKNNMTSVKKVSCEINHNSLFLLFALFFRTKFNLFTGKYLVGSPHGAHLSAH